MITRHLGVLGGTFDPIHLGHLRTAVELLEHLGLDRLLLMPVGIPPHREAPQVTAQQRLQMLRFAVRGERRLQVDDRECRKPRTAYTVETLQELREEAGPGTALSFCLGADAFLGMHRWHRWQILPELAHIVVVARPGWTMPRHLGPLEVWRKRMVNDAPIDSGPAAALPVDALRQSGSGRIVFVSLTPIDISATAVRERIARGQSARFLVPDSVWRYICRNGLYSGGAE